MSQDAQTFAVNETDFLRVMDAREAFMGGAIDAKRPMAWRQYGYPDEVTFPMLLKAYERGGAGHGAVHRLLDGCWQVLPRIKKKAVQKDGSTTKGNKEEKTPWEEKLAGQLKEINAWGKLRDFDRRNMVGRYAALIYRVADGKLLNEPLLTGSKLVDIVPVYEAQIKVLKWNEDELSQDYGKPEMFQLETSPPANDTEARPRTWLKVHPSRVQILAEGAVGDNFFDGVPLLKAGFNALIDLEKVSGGSGESFLKNSSRTLVFSYDANGNVQALNKEANGAPAGSAGQSVRQVHEEQTRSLNRNIDSSIVLQGGKAETLQTTIADPSKPFEVAANIFAASVQLPFTVLFGQQTGRLASDEDKTDATKRYRSRQENELTHMIEQFIKRGQKAGYFEAGEFEIEWPDISEPSDEKKLANGKTMAETNQVAFNGGATEPVFDNNEIRKAAGYEEREAGGDEFKEDVPPVDPMLSGGPPGTKPPVKKPATAAS